MGKGKVTVILGGQAGSEGKGKFAGYMAINDKPDVAVSNFMTNAGHTWVSDEGDIHMVQLVPQSAVNPKVDLMISAGAALTLDVLEKELERYSTFQRNIYIHERAMIIEQRHVEEEQAELNRISSTLKGCGHALADKARRGKDVKLAKDLVDELYQMGAIVIPDEEFTGLLMMSVDNGHDVLIECPQGFDLDINHGLEYPYCTSRQTTTAQAIADAGLPPQVVTDVIAVIRPYPIRVGNAYDENGKMVGTSGSYANSAELTWEEIAERSGTPFEEISEFTTVTKKLRRVFEIDYKRLKHMCQVNGVTGIALNFANYIDYNIKGKSNFVDITPKVRSFINKLEYETGVKVVMIGTGAKHSEIIDLRTNPAWQSLQSIKRD